MEHQWILHGDISGDVHHFYGMFGSIGRDLEARDQGLFEHMIFSYVRQRILTGKRAIDLCIGLGIKCVALLALLNDYE